MQNACHIFCENSLKITARKLKLSRYAVFCKTPYEYRPEKEQQFHLFFDLVRLAALVFSNIKKSYVYAMLPQVALMLLGVAWHAALVAGVTLLC